MMLYRRGLPRIMPGLIQTCMISLDRRIDLWPLKTLEWGMSPRSLSSASPAYKMELLFKLEEYLDDADFEISGLQKYSLDIIYLILFITKILCHIQSKSLLVLVKKSDKP